MSTPLASPTPTPFDVHSYGTSASQTLSSLGSLVHSRGGVMMLILAVVVVLALAQQAHERSQKEKDEKKPR